MGKNPVYQQCLDEKKPHGKLYHQHQKECKLPRSNKKNLSLQIPITKDNIGTITKIMVQNTPSNVLEKKVYEIDGLKVVGMPYQQGQMLINTIENELTKRRKYGNIMRVFNVLKEKSPCPTSKINDIEEFAILHDRKKREYNLLFKTPSEICQLKKWINDDDIETSHDDGDQLYKNNVLNEPLLLEKILGYSDISEPEDYFDDNELINSKLDTKKIKFHKI